MEGGEKAVDKKGHLIELQIRCVTIYGNDVV